MASSKFEKIVLTEEERKRLERIKKQPKTPQKHVRRAAIILDLAAGHGVLETCRRTGSAKRTIWRWWERFLAERVDGLLYEASRPPGKKPVPQEKVNKMLELAATQPPLHMSHWATRELGRRMQLGRSTVHRILARHGIKLHLVKTYKVSRDPQFVEKTLDVVGVLSDHPEGADLLSSDVKPQSQARQVTQRPLPAKRGHPQTRTHDYKRGGTTCLYAALDIKTGKVSFRHSRRQRSVDFLAFLEQLLYHLDPDMPVHVILDNASPHKSRRVKKWLKEHPNWHFHFIPTSASWMNPVEGVFSKVARGVLKNRPFGSIKAVRAALKSFLRQHNKNTAPFPLEQRPGRHNRGVEAGGPFVGSNPLGELFRRRSCEHRGSLVALQDGASTCGVNAGGAGGDQGHA